MPKWNYNRNSIDAKWLSLIAVILCLSLFQPFGTYGSFPSITPSIINQTSSLIWREIIQYDKYNETYHLKERLHPDITDKIISLEDVPKVEKIINNELMKRRVLAQDIFPCDSNSSLPTKKMTTNKIKLLDVVALIVDIPEYNLSKGQVGTVVEILQGGEVFEVEFSDHEGKLSPSIQPLSPEHLLVLSNYLV